MWDATAHHLGGTTRALRELTGSCMLCRDASFLTFLCIVPSPHEQEAVWLVIMQWEMKFRVF